VSLAKSTGVVDAGLSDDDALLLQDQDDDIASHPQPGVGARWVKPLVVVALIVGIIGGVYIAGRPGSSQPDPESVMAATEVDPIGRQAEVEAALAADPFDADAHLELGVILFNDGDLAGAYNHWLTVTQLDPENIRVWYNLGFYHLSTNPVDEAAAEAAWQQVINLDPESDLAGIVANHLEALANPAPAETATA